VKRAPDTRSLFAAARADGPSSTSRASMWREVEMGLALVPPAAASGTRLAEAARASVPSAPPAPPPPIASGTAVLKAGVIGGGIGSGVTVVAVLAALHGPSPTLSADVGVEPVRAASVDDAHEWRAPSVLAPIAAAPAEPSLERAAPAPASEGESMEDMLAREVSLVMGARAALVAGDPLRALSLASRAGALHGQLGHEARTLELRSLRALGREEEADRVEIELRVRGAGDGPSR